MMQCCHIMQPLPRGSIKHLHRRLPHLLFLLFLYSLTSCSNGLTAAAKKESTVPLFGSIPDTSFRCRGRSAGYYADAETGCQVYHMCDSLEKQYSYLCPNYTLFNQKFMVCDHWYMVNCSSSHTFYHLNSHIGEVPDKNIGEKEQNDITLEPPDDALLRRKGPPSRTPLPSAVPQPSRHPFKDTTRPQPAFKQSGTEPAKASVFRTPTKLVTPSTHFSITTSTIKPSTSSPRQFATPLNTQPKAPPVRQASASATTRPQQSFTPVSSELFPPTRQPFTPLNKNTRSETSIKGPFTLTKQPGIPTRQPFTPPTKQTTTPTKQQSFTPPTKQPTTPTRQQPFTPPTRQPITPIRQQPFTPSTRQPTTPTRHRPFTSPAKQPVTSTTISPVTRPTRRPVPQSTRQPAIHRPRQTVTPPVNHFRKEATVTIPEVQRESFSFLTPPKNEFSTHNIHTVIDNNQATVGHSNINSSLAIINNLSASRVGHTHTAQEEDPPTQTEQPSTKIKMKPSSVARSPGNRFTFTSHKEEEVALTPEELQRIVFQPLLARPRIKTRRILTSAPSLLPIDPANFSDPHHHHFPMRIEFPDPVIPEDSMSRSSLDLKLTNSQSQRVQTPSRILSPPSVSPAVPPLSSFLSPPTQPFTPITRMKQEFPTPLATPRRNINLRTSPRDTFLPGARHLPFPPSTRGNRDFFIPSAEFSEFSLLVSELPHNIVEEPAKDQSHSISDHHDHHHHHNNHMTMVFPAPIEPSMMKELKLNPECPRCHPEFLKPGQCHPCVVIK